MFPGRGTPRAARSLRLLAVISVILHLLQSLTAIAVSRDWRADCTGTLSFAPLILSARVNQSISAANFTVRRPLAVCGPAVRQRPPSRLFLRTSNACST